MAPQITEKGTVIAPFVNTEPAEYLVIEDNFPNGRPPLEKAGVIFTDRATVNRAERMKVSSCLNPLHTALAVFGFLLGYKSISSEMGDPILLALVKRIAYTEGLPTVDDPGVINPREFLDEVINKRLPNPMIPDAPPRIAADTSQKIPIRYGETIRSYMEIAKSGAMPGATRSTPQLQPPHNINSPAGLVGIPLTLAGWLRYLLGADDMLTPYTPSPDPMLAELRALLEPIKAGSSNPADNSEYTRVCGVLRPLLSDASLFGADLCEAGLSDKITGMFYKMNAGVGAVRATLEEYLL
jgi:fructuronate reductase